MKTSEDVKNITAALVQAHSELHNVGKNSTNPFFKSGYANLETVIDATKSILLKNNIIVVQGMDNDCLVTRLQHESGEYFESNTKLMLSKDDMQALGSAITYARRADLKSMLNIAETDDDGQKTADLPQPLKSGVMLYKENGGQGAYEAYQDTPPFDSLPDKNVGMDRFKNHALKVNNEAYVIDFGKFSGKEFDAIAFEEHINYANYLKRKANDDKKPLSGKAKFYTEYVNNHPASSDDIDSHLS